MRDDRSGGGLSKCRYRWILRREIIRGGTVIVLQAGIEYDSVSIIGSPNVVPVRHGNDAGASDHVVVGAAILRELDPDARGRCAERAKQTKRNDRCAATVYAKETGVREY